jgi:hypothetical protein
VLTWRIHDFRNSAESAGSIVDPVNSSPEPAGEGPARRIVMKNHTVLKKAIAATLLSAAFATPAAVLTAGAASARPIEGSCGAIAQSMQDSSHMADVAYAQGDRKGFEVYLVRRCHRRPTPP